MQRAPRCVLYTADLNLVLSSFGVAAHQFADDAQACVQDPAVTSCFVSGKNASHLLEVLGSWMSNTIFI